MRPSRTISITDQQLTILRILATGATVETAARQLDISPRTLRRRVEAVKHEIQVGTLIEAVARAAREGLL